MNTLSAALDARRKQKTPLRNTNAVYRSVLLCGLEISIGLMFNFIRPSLTLVLALAAGLSVANIYYNQPMLGLMEHEFGSHSGVSYLASATQLGYALGLLFLVPLGDTCDRRGLILWQTFALILALAIAAIAPTVSVLIMASIAIGIASTIAQQIIPMAAGPI